MSRITEIRQRIEEYQAANITAGALEDISSIRMQAIRRGFEKNRAFYEEMQGVYGVVQTYAKARAVPEKKPKQVRQLYVAITSNKRFYGKLTHDIIEALVARLVAEPKVSSLVVGKVGWQYFEQMGYARRGRALTQEDDVPTQEEFQTLLQHFQGFDRIYVFYPKFINPFRQEVGVVDITQSPTPAAVEQASHEQYIFEPEVPAMLSFFDTQVRRVLFSRVLFESELARTAARLVKMEEAQERSQKLLEQEQARLRRETATLSNTQLLETYAGFTQWNRI